MWQDEETPIDSESHWKYSFQYSGSQGNCRYLSVNSNSVIISGSRDGLVRTFFEDSLSETPIFKEVHSVATFSSPTNEWNVIIVGYRDGSIKLFLHDQKIPFVKFFDHSAAVCSLNIDQENGCLVSGGWDHNAFVYHLTETSPLPKWEKIFDLRGHSMSVWDGRSFPNTLNKQITGSADKSIKIWLDGVCIQTYLGYCDVIRSVMIMDNKYVIATGNEPTIFVWHIDCPTKPIKTIKSLSKSHLNSMEVMKNPLNNVTYCAVAGEEGFFQIFKVITGSGDSVDFNLVSLIDARLPVECIWKLVFMPKGPFTGDLVLGGENGKMYVYTLTESRMASLEIANKFLVESTEFAEIQDALKSKHENDEYFTFIIEPEVGQGQFELKHKIGSDPRETVKKFILTNNMNPSHYDQILEFLCSKCPDAGNYLKKKAVDTNSTDDIKRVKVLYDGREYDYCFDVSIGDKNVKLPYNVGEDPSEVASNFCEKNNLSIESLKTFTEFLYSQVPELKNSGYKQSNQNFNRVNRKEISRPVNCGLPITKLIEFKDFEGHNIAKMVSRLESGGEKYTENDKFITEDEYEIITNFFQTKDTSKLLFNNGSILQKLLLRSGEDILPVLHLIYLALNFEELAIFLNNKQRIIEIYKNILCNESTSPNFITMVFRGLANSCKHKAYLNVYQSEKMFFVNKAFYYATSSKQITQIAALSFMLNFVTASRGNDFQVSEIVVALLKKFSTIANCSQLSPQGIELILQIWGNMLYDRPDVIQTSLQNGAMNVIKFLKDRSSEGDSPLYARTIFNMLQRSQ
uniref:PUL domain-containing protein n=1 Tax=Strongyloides stercoralis TaxID=6248 RepID=A0A0K0EQN0_STRER